MQERSEVGGHHSVAQRPKERILQASGELGLLFAFPGIILPNIKFRESFSKTMRMQFINDTIT